MIKRLSVIILLSIAAGCATAPEPYEPGVIGTKTLSMAIPWYPIAKGVFTWPIRGSIIAPYGSKVGKVMNKGVNIKAEEGASVRAAKAGKVVYCNSNLKGFGKTVIIDHGGNIQTVYSYNSEILVHVGETVQQNAVIAKVGHTGRAEEPMLHFEVRRNGEPQNPIYYLRR